jgi:DNA-binding beta-propeller fold protein YncE
MMKKLLFLTICLLLIVSVGANAQWKFVKYFPDTTSLKYWIVGSGSGINNGVAVAPDGNIWLQSFSATCDTLLPAKWPTGCIRVYTPRGVQLPFSPIYMLSGKDQNGVAVTDTLSSLNSGNWGGTGYGLAVDPSTGNILSCKGGSRIWKIDYKTGKGIVRIAGPLPGYASSLSTVAADNFGEVFVSPVTPGATPIGILNPDFTSAGTVANSSQDYCRAMAVSGDGNDVYCAYFSQQKMMLFHSDNGSLGPYVKKDSILGLTFETAVWGPKTGYLWTTSGSTGGGVPIAPYLPYRWYAFDVKTKKVMDSIAWYDTKLPLYGNDERPRGIAFNKTGDTAYVTVFNSNDTKVGPAAWCQVFAKSGATSVEQDKNVIPTGYTLSQNYPNPFNPSTQIRFTITQTGMTSLKVYDVMGREVATLVDESMTPGAYTVKFDASHLSSGTYMYVLTSGSARLTNKMMLVK